MKSSLQTCDDQDLSFQAREHNIEWVESITGPSVNFNQKFSLDFHIDVIAKKDL